VGDPRDDRPDSAPFGPGRDAAVQAINEKKHEAYAQKQDGDKAAAEKTWEEVRAT
jgi:hypothetical protein